MTGAAPRVLILGGDGFIGRHIAFGLRAAGWDVLASARRTARLSRMGFATFRADLTHPKASDPEFWRATLDGVTHVVNAAGVLTANGAISHTVHVSAPAALYAALPEGIKGVLISAVGIGDADTDFACHRLEGEALAAQHDLTVLRAGLVLGETSYGGSSLVRALAALPFATPVVGLGEQQFNPIHAADLAELVAACLRNPPPKGIHEIGGPEIVTQAQMLVAIRAWLGLAPARILKLPLGMARLMGRLGDLMRLGPISATSVTQLEAGVLANTSPDLRALSPQTRGFSTFMAARPAGTQDLWHARLYLMRPVLRLVLACMWAVSGLIGLSLPAGAFLPLVPDTPLGPSSLTLMARIGGVLDLFIALALLRGTRPRLMAWVQVAMVAGYTAVFSLLAPALWLLPLGGLLKNLPVLALIAVTAVLEEER